jgi:hypothetical protein
MHRNTARLGNPRRSSALRFFGSTTNQVCGWEIQFSVFSFQNLEISSYSCDSFYSWFTIFAFFDKDVIHESNAVFHGLA